MQDAKGAIQIPAGLKRPLLSSAPRETNGPRRTEIEYFMHNEYMPFINSLVRVRSNCSGSVGLGGALFLSHTAGDSWTVQNLQLLGLFL